jgi:hypothetical protein
MIFCGYFSARLLSSDIFPADRRTLSLCDPRGPFPYPCPHPHFPLGHTPHLFAPAWDSVRPALYVVVSRFSFYVVSDVGQRLPLWPLILSSFLSCPPLCGPRWCFLGQDPGLKRASRGRSGVFPSCPSPSFPRGGQWAHLATVYRHPLAINGRATIGCCTMPNPTKVSCPPAIWPMGALAEMGTEPELRYLRSKLTLTLTPICC